MEIPLNAMDEPPADDDAPPAFTIPMRGNAVSLSSLLSAAEGDHDRDRSAQPPQHQRTHFPTDVAPIAVPAEQPAMAPAHHRPRARSGLSALMNSPMDDDVLVQDPRGYVTEPTSISSTTTVTSTMRSTSATSSTPVALPAPALQQQQQTPMSPAALHVTAPTSTTTAPSHKMDVDSEAVASPRSTSDSPVAPLRQRKGSVVVELNVQSVVLEDAELERLKSDFQVVVQKYLAIEARGESSAPSAKRQKKGKHARGKAKAAPPLTAGTALSIVYRLTDSQVLTTASVSLWDVYDQTRASLKCKSASTASTAASSARRRRS